MKKVLAVLLAVVTTTSIFAQQDYDKNNRTESRDHSYSQPDNRSVYNSNKHADVYKEERNRQIERVKQNFDFQIESVKRDRGLRHSEKKRRIDFLERERNQRIGEVMANSSHGRNDRDDRMANNNRRF